ncbi:MAG: adenylate kinase [Fimbriimonas sp.]
MRRVHIRGTSGSGKSTLGQAIAARIRVPAIQIDDHWHLPGWKERPLEEFRDRIAGIVAGDGWVLDGNYTKVTDLIFARADTVVWLDYPFPIVLRRVIWRTLRRAYRREVICNGNRESIFKSFFTRDSIIWWSFTTYRKNRVRCEEGMADPNLAHLTHLRFRHPREAEAWLRSLPNGEAEAP